MRVRFEYKFILLQVSRSLNSCYCYILQTGASAFTWIGNLSSTRDHDLLDRMLELIHVTRSLNFSSTFFFLILHSELYNICIFSWCQSANLASRITEGRERIRYFLECAWWKGWVSEGKRNKRTHGRPKFVYVEHNWRYIKCPNFLIVLSKDIAVLPWFRIVLALYGCKNVLITGFCLFCILIQTPHSGDFKVYFHKL